MLITITDELIDEIVANDNISINCLEILSQQLIEGNHLLFIPREQHGKMLTACNNLSKRASAAIIKSINRSAFSYSLFISVDIYISLESKASNLRHYTKDKQQIISIPSKEVSQKSSLVSKVIFLTENNDDCLFYIKYGKLFSELFTEQKIYANIPLRFDNISGFGGNMWQQFKTMKKSGDRIIFSMTDSDQEFPEARYGDTAKNLISEYNSPKESAITHVYVIETRDSENLIPFKAFLEAKNGISTSHEFYALLSNKDLQKEYWPYLDIKKGLKFKEIEEKTSKGKYLSKFFQKKCCNCTTIKDCDHYIFQSCNSKILRNTLEVEGNKITLDCYHHIHDYWSNISKKIHSFFCGSEADYVL